MRADYPAGLMGDNAPFGFLALAVFVSFFIPYHVLFITVGFTRFSDFTIFHLNNGNIRCTVMTR